MNERDSHYKSFRNGDQLIEPFQRLFINRDDTYAIQVNDGTYTRIDAALTKDVLKRHLIGEVTVGAYTTNPKDQTTKTMVFDIDPEHVKDPEGAARSILKTCEGKFPEAAVLLEASRHSDPSYHLWVFFEPPIPVKAARYLGQRVMEQAGVVVELFPKQDVVEEGGFGNLVKLPLGLHQKQGKRSCFLDKRTFQPLRPNVLLDVCGCSFPETDLEKIMELADKQQGVQTKLEPTGKETHEEVKDLFAVPCIKTFRDQPIPPGKRHLSYAKNIAVLYRQTKGSFDGFENFAVELVRNQRVFDVRDVMGWMSWAVAPGRKLNCEELRRFLLNYVSDFTCAGCPLHEKELTVLEAIGKELEGQKTVKFHPVIDYHPEMGLTYGVFLRASSQTLIISKEKAFAVDSEALEIQTPFANSHPAGEASISAFHRIYSEQMLLESRELLEGRKIENTPQKEVFQKTLAETRAYWHHSDQRYHNFLACWIIGSYMHVIFGRYPPLHLQGPRRSGKSTLIDFLSHVAWNPTDPSHALRSAPLFRTIEGKRPSLLVDITKLNPKSEEYGDIVDVFEAGGEEGHVVLRCIGEDKEPVAFHVFCPKAVASRQDLPFQDKCIRIITESTKNRGFTQRRRFMRWDPELPALVADLLRGALNLWPDVLKAYQDLEQTDKLMGRPFDLWSPILAVCRVFASDHYEELLSLAEWDAENRERGDMMSEVEDAVLAILSPIEGETVSYLLKDLTEKVQNRVPWVKTWHPVQSAVTNLGIARRKYQTTSGVAYEFDLIRVRKRAEDRGIALKDAGLDPKDVVRLARLHPAEEGECAFCGQRKTLDFQVETEEETWGFVCVDCAERIRKENPGVEWLE